MRSVRMGIPKVTIRRPFARIRSPVEIDLEAAIGVDVGVDERCDRRHWSVSDRLDQWASTPHAFAECSSRWEDMNARAVQAFMEERT